MPPLRTTTFVAKPINPTAEVKPVDPFFILGSVFLGLSIVCSIAAFAYGEYLSRSSAMLVGESQKIEEDLQQYPLKDMLAFNNRVTMVQKLLKNHTFPETIFTALASGIEKNVYYNSFNLSYSPGVGHSLALSAVAPDYAMVAKQMDALKNTAYGSLFKSVEMSNLGKDQYGNKMFDISIKVVGSLKDFQSPIAKQVNTNTVAPVTPVIKSAPAVTTKATTTTATTTKAVPVEQSSNTTSL